MKRTRILNTLTVLIIAFANLAFVTPPSSYALSTVCNDPNVSAAQNGVSGSAFCQDTTSVNPLYHILTVFIDVFSAIVGIIAVVVIIISGLQIIMSGGNSEKISNARDRIIYASIGLVVVAIAQIIVMFVISKAT